MKTSTIILTIGITLLAAACKTLPMVNSVEEEKAHALTSKYYDSKSQIRYRVSNDHDHLHLNIKTNYEPTIAKILRAGLTIYFDPSGRKKKDIYVKYPIGSPQDVQQVKPSGPRGKKPDLKTLINATSIGAEFVYNEKKKNFTTLNPTSNIQLSIKSNSSKELEYDLIIPFKEITPNGRADLMNLSIGIVTEGFDMTQRSPLENQGGMDSGRSGGGRMPQQGASSNSASYGGGGKGPRSGSSPHSGMTDMNEDSKIWFQVGLYR